MLRTCPGLLNVGEKLEGYNSVEFGHVGMIHAMSDCLGAGKSRDFLEILVVISFQRNVSQALRFQAVIEIRM